MAAALGAAALVSPHSARAQDHSGHAMPMAMPDPAPTPSSAPEPALGPSAFMHRASARYNPEAPITHHWFDSTHITYGVVTAGVSAPKWQLEAGGSPTSSAGTSNPRR